MGVISLHFSFAALVSFVAFGGGQVAGGLLGVAIFEWMVGCGSGLAIFEGSLALAGYVCFGSQISILPW